VARRATGVVWVAAIPRLAWFYCRRSNHPVAAYGHGLPSLSKEGSFVAELRDRN